MKPIGYFTDNNVSHTAMKAFSRAGFPVKHIRDFYRTQPAIFYGMLRGSGPAMRHLEWTGIDYWYVDNGYFDAIYMNEGKRKDMSGKYRVVKNGMMDIYQGQTKISVHAGEDKFRFLLIPPSPYTAFMHDTTPEDWLLEWGQKIHNLGHSRKVRDKTETTPLEDELADCDAVFAFNSMAVMKAIQMNKFVYTTHGIIRNSAFLGKYLQKYDFDVVRSFYESKQFTLEEIAEGKLCLT